MLLASSRNTIPFTWAIATTLPRPGGCWERMSRWSASCPGAGDRRGECALTDKWTRAELALRGGADLVLELPLPWAISSAENFARGSIDILKATGVVDTISFGSESGCLDEMFRVAKVIKTKEFQKALHEELDKGFSFAEARQKAVYQIIGDAARLLGGANDNLGVEYIRAAGESLECWQFHGLELVTTALFHG